VRLLLDTHALLWWIDAHERLSREAYAAIEDPANDVFVSSISPWEIEVKQALGKLRAPAHLRDRLHDAGFSPLVITLDHGFAVGELPLHHQDPFDRMLVAQARLEGLTMVTRDPQIARYDVEVMPA
jgi:PIN domain nuclease of toxin-antitoxin system